MNLPVSLRTIQINVYRATGQQPQWCFLNPFIRLARRLPLGLFLLEGTTNRPSPPSTEYISQALFHSVASKSRDP